MKQHLLSFTIALILVTLTLYVNRYFPVRGKEILEGKQTIVSGWFENLRINDSVDLEYAASLQNQDQITILGSSELTAKSNYLPFRYLPDSIGIQALGIGHAGHQELSMLCELLALDEYVTGSKICIVFSPTWLTTPGTTSATFLEYVTPNFLNNIASNPSIDQKYKKAIGSFIAKYKNDFSGMIPSMELLMSNYLMDTIPSSSLIYYKHRIAHYLKSINSLKRYEYKPLIQKLPEKTRSNIDSNRVQALKNNFIAQITTNSIYVNDIYYKTYLIDEQGNPKVGATPAIDIPSNPEFKDFKLLVDYLTKKKAHASFIIQPLNPYYYNDLGNYNGIIDSITNILDKNKIPYLNMFVSEKEQYDPGILTDIMHLGDYGWMKINKFLLDTYYEKK